VIQPDALVLLDTNVLVELVRGKTAGLRIDDRYGLRVYPARSATASDYRSTSRN